MIQEGYWDRYDDMDDGDYSLVDDDVDGDTDDDPEDPA
jgi:hypothetical protein